LVGFFVEASALQAPSVITRGRTSIGSPLLRLRSDEQLVELFRAGHEEAFRVIHDRYRVRLFAYTRQMLPTARQDAEDVLQDVFVRAYSGLRASDRRLALRAWLYRVAHNRCVDQLRRQVPVVTDTIETAGSHATYDPIAAAEQRETLRRLIADVQRLPEQQRSALLMRELSGMSYAELAEALSLSVPAVKSLLVRARVSLAAALEARETACEQIRSEIVDCHDRGVRPTAMARRHLHDCDGCREFRSSVRGISRNFAALTPAFGPLALLAKFGISAGGGSAAGSGSSGAVAAGGGAAAAAGGGAVAAAGGAGGAVATGVMTGTAGHVAAVLAAAIVTAGGAVEIQPALAPAHHHHHHSLAATHRAHAIAASASAQASALAILASTVPTPPAKTTHAKPAIRTTTKTKASTRAHARTATRTAPKVSVVRQPQGPSTGGAGIYGHPRLSFYGTGEPLSTSAPTAVPLQQASPGATAAAGASVGAANSPTAGGTGQAPSTQPASSTASGVSGSGTGSGSGDPSTTPAGSVGTDSTTSTGGTTDTGGASLDGGATTSGSSTVASSTGSSSGAPAGSTTPTAPTSGATATGSTGTPASSGTPADSSSSSTGSTTGQGSAAVTSGAGGVTGQSGTGTSAGTSGS
jgi:RNA polymerase sigma factor (sigma-70 family)